MKKAALDYHKKNPRGKLEVQPTKKMDSDWDLSLAYSPGVAEPCREIAKNQDLAFDYTAKGNLVAVVTNGSAVLGLGNIGPLAGKPVMEGKAALFKKFAGIDAFDLEIKAKTAEEFVTVCKSLEPSFGGINLEDIAAPACFEIETALEREMSIPVFHDDQHGTAIITAAAFLNACHIQGKKPEEARIVFSGAGAAGIACAKLLLNLGAQKSHIIICDSLGVIRKGRRERMNPHKKEFASDTPHRSLAEALRGADAFIGLSAKGILTPGMVKSMAPRPIVFAMANPDPEIHPEEAKKASPEAIIATGRTDFPNQVNNVLGFPFIFRGALDVRATHINETMKMAAVHALAQLARSRAPHQVSKAYQGETFRFGPDYIIPKPFDLRALTTVAPAVARAAMESGAARRPIKDFKKYIQGLETMQSESRGFVRTAINRINAYQSGAGGPAAAAELRRKNRPRPGGEPGKNKLGPAQAKTLHQIKSSPSRKQASEQAPRNIPRIFFPEGESQKILTALNALMPEKILEPVLLGEESRIRRAIKKLDLPYMDSARIICPREDAGLSEYAELFCGIKKTGEKEALQLLSRPDYFAAMALRQGRAAALVSGATDTFAKSILPSLRIIGSGRRGIVAGVNIALFKSRVLFFADTAFNIDPSAEQIAHIAIYAAQAARYFSIEPRIAMLSFVNFSDGSRKSPLKMKQAAALVKKWKPDLKVEGEVQADIAVNGDIAGEIFPRFAYSKGANVLIFPSLDAGNIAYKLVQQLGPGEVLGPLLMGIKKPVNIVQRTCSVDDAINTIVLTALKVHAYEDLDISGEPPAKPLRAESKRG